MTNKQLLGSGATGIWVTPGDAAAALGVSTRTVSRLADEGKIRAIKPGGTQRRYAAADIEALLARDADWSPAS